MLRFFTVIAMLCMAPVRRLDRAVEARGQDPEAGLTTLEYVILGALVLAVVVTVAAVITGNLEDWADQIPSP
ncbi:MULTISPECIES: hypothetical protein [Janibacter]|uniref:Uncharacterized protein n=1 Tax=Janibacter indicus TaxID=857417 RepID=A0A1W2CDV8_9MICO|nr:MULTISPECIES: hypothetical protein [Janibacter]QNF93324.1 hypothetical protein H7A72_11095 [Janibacter sp. YB324]SMC83380.1 hypothetical protein SAMN06296429_1115 [Janibacter indicus]